VDNLEKTLSGCYNFESMGKSVLDPSMALILQAMSLCNKSSFDHPQGEPKRRFRPVQANTVAQAKIVGNPTEGALLKAASSFFDVMAFRDLVG